MWRILGLLGILCIMVWGFGLWLSTTTPTSPMPTLLAVPSMSASSTPTQTHTPTATFTATASPSATFTLTPSLTPTLSTRLLEMTVVMPGVFVPAPPTPFPVGTILLPAPPAPIEPLPNATYEVAPFVGWYRFESDHPAVHYPSAWQPRLHAGASQGQYHRTDNPQGGVRFGFAGQALRIHYIVAENMGAFEVVIDGIVRDRVDAYAPELGFMTTPVYEVSFGEHTLELRGVSQGTLSLDAIDVFYAADNMLILPPSEVTDSPTPQFSRDIQLVSAPPTVQPTLTPQPPGEVTVALVIGYDENGNRAVDPAEGVRDIPVQIGTNRVLAQAVTDGQGYAQIQLVISAPAQVVVPYFGRVWQLSNTRRGQVALTLLLTPGNQPGLIP
jgi:hypothetical protein